MAESSKESHHRLGLIKSTRASVSAAWHAACAASGIIQSRSCSFPRAIHADCRTKSARTCLTTNATYRTPSQVADVVTKFTTDLLCPSFRRLPSLRNPPTHHHNVVAIVEIGCDQEPLLRPM